MLRFLSARWAQICWKTHLNWPGIKMVWLPGLLFLAQSTMKYA